TYYASITYPVSFPRFLANQAGIFREIQRATSTYDLNTDIWSNPGWAAMTPQPPGPFQGTNIGQGWYDSVISVQPGNPNFLFVAAVGARARRGRDVGSGANRVAAGPGAGGRGPIVVYHAATWDNRGRLIVGSAGGVWRRKVLPPPAVATW